MDDPHTAEDFALPNQYIPQESQYIPQLYEESFHNYWEDGWACGWGHSGGSRWYSSRHLLITFGKNRFTGLYQYWFYRRGIDG